MPSPRLYLYFSIFTVWFWANSIFAPWAEDLNPRLWLYDLLFYTRFVLLFWGGVELLIASRQILDTQTSKRNGYANIIVIGMATLSVSAYLYLMYTGNGFRLRTKISASALAALQEPGFSDQRQRIGWFLVDNRRQPCPKESWLWLGEVYGGGSGNNLALVHSKNQSPKTPVLEAFRFWPLNEQWWLAYQNPDRYYKDLDVSKYCVDGKIVKTHEQGMQFIKAHEVK